MNLRLLRNPEVTAQTGVPPQTLRDHINAGTFPPPVRTGGRVVTWPEHEVQQMVAARIRGDSEEQLRALCRKLVQDRATVLLDEPTRTLYRELERVNHEIN